MATSRAVAAALAVLGRAFAGVVDEERVDVYCAALEDLSDADLAIATAHVVKTHTGEFIPPPAVLRKAVAPAPIAVDSSAVLRRIENLAIYSPQAGMIYPRGDVVRDALGEAIAYAYAAAGGERVFSDNETTREIATREFQKALAEAVSRPGAALLVVGQQTSALPPARVRIANVTPSPQG